jgi:nucleoside-diphosphate-sugar epimerase
MRVLIIGGTILHTLGWGTAYLDRLRQGRPVIVHGDGTSFWMACHRSDVAAAFVKALGNPDAVGRAYHVTGEEWLTWDVYTRIVAQAVGGPEPRIVHIPTDLLGKALPKKAQWCVENFHYNNLFDNTLAHRDLGFSYTVPFADGARRVVDWLDQHGGFDDWEDDLECEHLLQAWQVAGGDVLRAMDRHND